MDNQVETKVYECLEDFVLPSVVPGQEGGVSYTKGEKYQFPAEILALVPEGVLQEVTPEPPTPKPAPVPAKPFVGGHTMEDRG